MKTIIMITCLITLTLFPGTVLSETLKEKIGKDCQTIWQDFGYSASWVNGCAKCSEIMTNDNCSNCANCESECKTFCGAEFPGEENKTDYEVCIGGCAYGKTSCEENCTN